MHASTHMTNEGWTIQQVRDTYIHTTTSLRKCYHEHMQTAMEIGQDCKTGFRRTNNISAERVQATKMCRSSPNPHCCKVKERGIGQQSSHTIFNQGLHHICVNHMCVELNGTCTKQSIWAINYSQWQKQAQKQSTGHMKTTFKTTVRKQTASAVLMKSWLQSAPKTSS